MKHIQINASVTIALEKFEYWLKYVDGTIAFHKWDWVKGRSGYELFAVDNVGIVYYYLISSKNTEETKVFEEHYKNRNLLSIPKQINNTLHTKKGDMKSENTIGVAKNILLRYFEFWGNWEFIKKGDSISIAGIAPNGKDLLFNVRNQPVYQDKYQRLGEFNVLVPEHSKINFYYHHKEAPDGNHPFDVGYVCESLNARKSRTEL